jgi:hypothetical protein
MREEWTKEDTVPVAGLWPVVTADGSVTASLRPGGETMHSRNGAWSETRYVYGTALRFTRLRGWPLRIVSVGLGLGYTELMVAALAPSLDSLASFELSAHLRERFLLWVGAQGKDAISLRVAAAVARATGVPVAALRERLAGWRANGRWVVRGALEREAVPWPASLILFDAFSPAISPQLWDESFLGGWLQRTAGRPCVFSTYAARGSLRRALQGAGFRVRARRGFGGKRESTFAVR